MWNPSIVDNVVGDPQQDNMYGATQYRKTLLCVTHDLENLYTVTQELNTMMCVAHHVRTCVRFGLER